MASFDPTKQYTTTTDAEGNLFFFQYPFFFDKYGNQSATIPRSQGRGFLPPHRNAPMATLCNPLSALPYTLLGVDVGTILDVLAAGTITVPPGFSNYACIFIPPSSGTLTLAAGAGVLLNGAGTSLTRTRANNATGFSLVPTSVQDSYLVGGT